MPQETPYHASSLPIQAELLFFIKTHPRLTGLLSATLYRLIALNGGSRESTPYWSLEDRAYSEFYSASMRTEVFAHRIAALLPSLFQLIDDCEELERAISATRIAHNITASPDIHRPVTFNLEWLQEQNYITADSIIKIKRAQAWLLRVSHMYSGIPSAQHLSWKTLADAEHSLKYLQQLSDGSLAHFDEALHLMQSHLEIEPEIEATSLEILELFQKIPYPTQSKQ